MNAPTYKTESKAIRPWATIALLLMAGLFQTSCGKNPFESNPLKEEPSYIQNAQPGYQKIEEKALTSEELLILSNMSYFSFVAGVTTEIRLQSQTLREGYNSTLSVDNLTDFAGGQFDSASGRFTWTPPVNIVPRSTDQLELNLRVRIMAQKQGSPLTQTRTRDFPIYVSANRQAPQFVRMEPPISTMREGEVVNFSVYFKSLSASGPTNAEVPILHVEKALGASQWNSVDLASYISVGRPEPVFQEPSVWRYLITIDLRNKVLIRDTLQHQGVFRLSASSMTNLQSAPVDLQIALYPSVSRPVATVTDITVIWTKAGAHFEKEFAFFDETERGDLTAEILNATSFPAGLVVECRHPNSYTSWIQTCHALWDLPANYPKGRQRISIRLTNRSQVTGDQRRETRTYDYDLQIE